MTWRAAFTVMAYLAGVAGLFVALIVWAFWGTRPPRPKGRRE